MAVVLRRDGWRCLVLVSVSLVYLSICCATMTGGKLQLKNPYKYKEITDGITVILERMKVNNGLAYKVVCDTLKASSQVVQGTLYRVAMKVAPEGNDPGACIGGTTGRDERFVCFTIWSRPWLPDANSRFIVEEKPNISETKDCFNV